MTTNSLNSIALGLADLGRFERGHATFELGDDDEVTYTGTEATVKMREGESLPDFFKRLRAEHGLRKGDAVQLINNGRGQLDTARVLKKPW